MKLAEAYVEIRAENRQLRAGMVQAQGIWRRGLRKMQATYVAHRALIRRGLFALGGLLLGSVYLAAKQEEANRRMAASMKYVGAFTKEAYWDLKRFASGLQAITTYGDETIQDMLSLGMTLGRLSGQELKDTTIAAMGLAEVIGKDLPTAMTLMARAAGGQFELFSRFGIILDKFNTDAEKMNYLLEMGKRGFEIQKSKAQGLGGVIIRLKNYFFDLGEKIGFAADKAFDLKKDLGKLEDWAKTSKLAEQFYYLFLTMTAIYRVLQLFAKVVQAIGLPFLARQSAVAGLAVINLRTQKAVAERAYERKYGHAVGKGPIETEEERELGAAILEIRRQLKAAEAYAKRVMQPIIAWWKGWADIGDDWADLKDKWEKGLPPPEPPQTPPAIPKPGDKAKAAGPPTYPYGPRGPGNPPVMIPSPSGPILASLGDGPIKPSFPTPTPMPLLTLAERGPTAAGQNKELELLGEIAENTRRKTGIQLV